MAHWFLESFSVYMRTTVTLRECVSLIVQCLKGLEKGSDVSFRVCKQEDSSYDLHLNQKFQGSDERLQVTQQAIGENGIDSSEITLSGDSIPSKLAVILGLCCTF